MVKHCSIYVFIYEVKSKPARKIYDTNRNPVKHINNARSLALQGLKVTDNIDIFWF